MLGIVLTSTKSTLLSVDETIKSSKAGGEAPPQMMGRGMGRPMM